MVDEYIIADAAEYIAHGIGQVGSDELFRCDLEGGLIANQAYNARAGIGGPDRYFIGVNVGRLWPVLEALKKVWAPSDSLDANVRFVDGMSKFLSLDNELKFTLRTIMRHELAHIANGHIDWGVALDRAPTSLERQTLEMDADCVAVKAAIVEYLGLIQSTGRSGEQIFAFASQTDREMGNHQARVLGSALLGYFATTDAILGETPFVTGEVTSLLHPPTIVRFGIAVGLFGTICLEFPEAYELSQAFIEGAGERDLILAAHYGRDPYSQLLSAGASKGVWRYTAKLMECWSTIRPDLEPLKKTPGELAAAQTWSSNPPDSHIFP